MKQLYTKLNQSIHVEWLTRILITINLIFSVTVEDEHYFPLIIIGLSLISLWLYCYKNKLIALFPLFIGFLDTFFKFLKYNFLVVPISTS